MRDHAALAEKGTNAGRCVAEQKARKAVLTFFIAWEKRLKWTKVQVLAISSHVGLVGLFLATISGPTMV